MWISWKHQDSDFAKPLTFDQKVDVFYEQTLGWQLHIADLMTNTGIMFGASSPPRPEDKVPYPIRHSGFAVLHVCLSYFELIGSLVDPKTKRLRDNEKFKLGVQTVLPSLFKGTSTDIDLLSLLYEGARCGLYHVGRTGARVGLGQPADGSPIAYDPTGKVVQISPERLPVMLKKHLETFKAELLNPANTTLRREFEKQFDGGFKK